MHRRTSLAALAALTLLPVASYAQTQASPKACDPAPARATSVQGVVESSRAGERQWRTVALNDTFCPGDAIRVGARSRADLLLLDQSVLRLNANSGITIEAPKERATGVVDLVRGAVHFLSRGPRSLEVKTPFTIAGVRGTEFMMSIEAGRALVTVFEGTVVAENNAGSLTLRDGESAVAEPGKAPAPRVVLRPRDAVHWALHYPPVAEFRAGEFPPGTLEKASADVRDPRAHAFRAQRLLAVGAVDEATGELGRALQLAPGHADALGLQSVMALVQGDKERALQLAQQAVTAAPGSATALIARSYAEQARFDLVAARASAQQAVTAEPGNALALARLAELHSAFGDLDDALSAAQRAVELRPDLSRTQTVVGFAHLIRTDIPRARLSFENAIALDQADPLPRLGLGLAKIRAGQLEEGSRDLEVAASLDAGNALVRSYLGKAYYEEKRSPLDEREYGVAKQLDPRDPTPWFYDAIAKQTTNRPVEALASMAQAIELNDNRAVYRSRLLLDSDAAARSASLARIYADLGFQQRALVEGWTSVNADPGNFSAHRFLADAYAALPRHEIARVSELLQSQLLQPLNMTPIQPRLAESNLFLVSAAGPGIASFNEFNPLFTRNGATVLASGLAGSNDTSGGEAVAAGILGQVGLSVGYTRFRTDGFRTNADQEETIANAFVQVELTPRTSVQAEYRERDSTRGDLRQRFFTEDFFAGERNQEDTETYRLGLRHAFSPGSILLASFIRQEALATLRDDQFDPAFGLFLDLRSPVKSSGGELQHLFRRPRFNLTTGVGHFDVEGRLEAKIGFVPSGPLLVDDVIPADVRHTNVYGYAQIEPAERLVLTLGASYDDISGDSPDIEGIRQWNPKLGIAWEPVAGTLLRAGAFRTLKRTLITNQTLEPTQVAGFNQFFDDVDGTKAKRYGAALDQKFRRNVFGGVELSKRDLDVPRIVGTTAERDDGEERLARAYAFWAPARAVALRAEYAYEQFDFASATEGQFVKTHRVPLGVSLFHASGLSASFTATYYDQRVTLERGALGLESGRDKFWLADAALSYRLPRRYGLISVGARNLFDEEFRYFQTDAGNASILPVRQAFVQATLALP